MIMIGGIAFILFIIFFWDPVWLGKQIGKVVLGIRSQTVGPMEMKGWQRDIVEDD